MSVHETVLRMACALWIASPTTTLTPAQAGWLLTRINSQTPFTAQEKTRLKAPLLAWARAYDAGVAAIIARQFATEDVVTLTPGEAWDWATLHGTAPPASGLSLLAQYPGTAGREEAAALQPPAPPEETKGPLL